MYEHCGIHTNILALSCVERVCVFISTSVHCMCLQTGVQVYALYNFIINIFDHCKDQSKVLGSVNGG